MGSHQSVMLSFALYLVGAIVVIAGLAWIATLLGAAGALVTSGAAAMLLVAAAIGIAHHRRSLEPPGAR
jgi:apolipoprotein N-acyltransferase